VKKASGIYHGALRKVERTNPKAIKIASASEVALFNGAREGADFSAAFTTIDDVIGFIRKLYHRN
jgi:hypothetical protein